jgi:hypothetical protein
VKINQAQKVKYCMILLNAVSRRVDLIEIESYWRMRRVEGRVEW